MTPSILNARLSVPFLTHPAKKMLLQKYLEQEGLTQRAFAIRAGIEQASVSRYVRGMRMPTAVTMRRIEQITRGAVTMEDFVPEHAWRKRRRKRNGA